MAALLPIQQTAATQHLKGGKGGLEESIRCLEKDTMRVISSNGRAIALHAIGNGIDARIIHFSISEFSLHHVKCTMLRIDNYYFTYAKEVACVADCEG